MIKYLIIAAAIAISGLSGTLVWKQNQISSLKTDNALLEAKLVTCSARLGNIMEDVKSDQEIDNWGDLTTVPDGWLLPAETARGGR